SGDLDGVRVEAAHLGAGNDRVGFGKQLGAGFDVGDETEAAALPAEGGIGVVLGGVRREEPGGAVEIVKYGALGYLVADDVQGVAECDAEVVNEGAVILFGVGAMVGGIDVVEDLDAVGVVGRVHGAVNAADVVAADAAEVGHRFHAAQAHGHVGLDGYGGQSRQFASGEERSLVVTRFHNGAVPDAVGDEPIVGGDAVGGLLPVAFGIKVALGLAAVGNAMEERKIAGVEERHKVDQPGIQRSEA